MALQTLDGKFRMLPQDDIADITQQKTSYMPAFQGTAAQRADLLAYLGTLGGIEAGPPTGFKPVAKEEIAAAMNPRPGEWATRWQG